MEQYKGGGEFTVDDGRMAKVLAVERAKLFRHRAALVWAYFIKPWAVSAGRWALAVAAGYLYYVLFLSQVYRLVSQWTHDVFLGFLAAIPAGVVGIAALGATYENRKKLLDGAKAHLTEFRHEWRCAAVSDKIHWR